MRAILPTVRDAPQRHAEGRGLWRQQFAGMRTFAMSRRI